MPKFIVEALKKRRSCDLVTLKNIAIANTVPIGDIQNMSSAQEKEITELFSEHKRRMTEIRERLAQLRAEEQPNGAYSTSSENLNDDSSQPPAMRFFD